MITLKEKAAKTLECLAEMKKIVAHCEKTQGKYGYSWNVLHDSFYDVAGEIPFEIESGFNEGNPAYDMPSRVREVQEFAEEMQPKSLAEG